jgi:hypothetical protein
MANKKHKEAKRALRLARKAEYKKKLKSNKN